MKGKIDYSETKECFLRVSDGRHWESYPSMRVTLPLRNAPPSRDPCTLHYIIIPWSVGSVGRVFVRGCCDTRDIQEATEDEPVQKAFDMVTLPLTTRVPCELHERPKHINSIVNRLVAVSHASNNPSFSHFRCDFRSHIDFRRKENGCQTRDSSRWHEGVTRQTRMLRILRWLLARVAWHW